MGFTQLPAKPVSATRLPTTSISWERPTLHSLVRRLPRKQLRSIDGQITHPHHAPVHSALTSTCIDGFIPLQTYPGCPHGNTLCGSCNTRCHRQVSHRNESIHWQADCGELLITPGTSCLCNSFCSLRSCNLGKVHGCLFDRVKCETPMTVAHTLSLSPVTVRVLLTDCWLQCPTRYDCLLRLTAAYINIVCSVFSAVYAIKTALRNQLLLAVYLLAVQHLNDLKVSCSNVRHPAILIPRWENSTTATVAGTSPESDQCLVDAAYRTHYSQCTPGCS